MGKRSLEDDSSAPKLQSSRKKQKDDIADEAAEASGVSIANIRHKIKTGYVEAVKLTELSQTEVDEFLEKSAIHIDHLNNGPGAVNLRPILTFAHLPGNAKNFPVFNDFRVPTPIQSAAWPFLLSERDLIGIAETGSGKTLAFGLPLIVRLGHKKQKRLRSIVLTPTRELALQVFDQLRSLAQGKAYHVACIYGGVGKDAQRKQLQKANIVVATPGRLKDFLNEGSISFEKVRYLVLDEADRMLDKGFEEDIKMLISVMPSSKKRQTAMFTATWPKSIRDLASTFMQDPIRVTIGHDRPDGELRANPRISQTVEVIPQHCKETRLLEIVRQHPARNEKILIFCLYKKEATRIERFLRDRGFSVAGIHGDMSQSSRLASLSAFKSGAVSRLVATDVAARGLDIPAVALVLNLTMSLTAEDYVHRIGRTGRAGAPGEAITLFTEADKALSGPLVNVLRAAKQSVPEALLRFGTTVKRKEHEAYGNFYREPEPDGKKATKITFDD